MKCDCIICGAKGDPIRDNGCFLCAEHWKWVQPDTAKAYRAAMRALRACSRKHKPKQHDKLWTAAVALFAECKDQARDYREGDLFRRAG